jgi:hypothetical protein
MFVSYDTFAEAFLPKVTEYKWLGLDWPDRRDIVDNYLRAAMTEFRVVARQTWADLGATEREFEVEVEAADLDTIVDIVTDGMVVQWLRPHMFNSELWENVISTREFSVHATANIARQVRETYDTAAAAFAKRLKAYSYDTADLSKLHT